MNKKLMNQSQKALYEYVLCGLGWVVLGVLKLFPSSILNLLVRIATLGLIALSIMITNRTLSDQPDEMSELHMLKAKSRTLSFVILGMMLLVCADTACSLIFHTSPVTLDQTYSFIVGGAFIVIGQTFRRLEKEGE